MNQTANTDWYWWVSFNIQVSPIFDNYCAIQKVQLAGTLGQIYYGEVAVTRENSP